LENNELRHHCTASKSTKGATSESQTSWSFNPIGEYKENIKDEMKDGPGTSSQRSRSRRDNGSRRSATAVRGKGGRSSSRINKTPIKPRPSKKKQAKPEVKAEDQVKDDGLWDIEQIVAKRWGPEEHPDKWCYLVMWEGGAKTYEPCAEIKKKEGGSPMLVKAFEKDMRLERPLGPRMATEVTS
jgi:hypothetical protein